MMTMTNPRSRSTESSLGRTDLGCVGVEISEARLPAGWVDGMKIHYHNEPFPSDAFFNRPGGMFPGVAREFLGYAALGGCRTLARFSLSPSSVSDFQAS